MNRCYFRIDAPDELPVAVAAAAACPRDGVAEARRYRSGRPKRRSLFAIIVCEVPRRAASLRLDGWSG